MPVKRHDQEPKEKKKRKVDGRVRHAHASTPTGGVRCGASNTTGIYKMFLTLHTPLPSGLSVQYVSLSASRYSVIARGSIRVCVRVKKGEWVAN